LKLYVLIGPPGGGKGSLSKLCTDKLGWFQLSTGNLCREHIAKHTDIGKKIDFIIKSGKLIPDTMITDMVEHWLVDNQKSNKSIIFDGYPRTVVQAQALTDLLKEKFHCAELHVVKLTAHEPTLIKRMSSRIVCSNSKCQAVYSSSPEFSPNPKQSGICDKCHSKLVQRSDDIEGAIKQRIVIYNKHEDDLLGYYKNIGQTVIQLDSEKNIDEVFSQFKTLVSN